MMRNESSGASTPHGGGTSEREGRGRADAEGGGFPRPLHAYAHAQRTFGVVFGELRTGSDGPPRTAASTDVVSVRKRHSLTCGERFGPAARAAGRPERAAVRGAPRGRSGSG